MRVRVRVRVRVRDSARAMVRVRVEVNVFHPPPPPHFLPSPGDPHVSARPCLRILRAQPRLPQCGAPRVLTGVRVRVRVSSPQP